MSGRSTNHSGYLTTPLSNSLSLKILLLLPFPTQGRAYLLGAASVRLPHTEWDMRSSVRCFSADLAQTWIAKRLQVHCPGKFLCCLISFQWSLPASRHGRPCDFWSLAGVPSLGRSDAGIPLQDGGGASGPVGSRSGSSEGVNEERPLWAEEANTR